MDTSIDVTSSAVLDNIAVCNAISEGFTSNVILLFSSSIPTIVTVKPGTRVSKSLSHTFKIKGSVTGVSGISSSVGKLYTLVRSKTPLVSYRYSGLFKKLYFVFSMFDIVFVYRAIDDNVLA